MSHKVLSRLDCNQQKFELSESLKILKTFKMKKPYLFAYPYGYKSSYNNTTIKILGKLKYNNAFVFDNKNANKNFKQFEISRIDCINKNLIKK